MIRRAQIGALTTIMAIGEAASATPISTQAGSSDAVVVVLTVEMPDGKSFSATVSDTDCPSLKMCGDYYGIHGYVVAGFEKLGLTPRESCRGRHGDTECEVVELGGVENSSSHRWTLFHAGHRIPYPYNRITREARPERIAYKFLPISSPNNQ